MREKLLLPFTCELNKVRKGQLFFRLSDLILYKSGDDVPPLYVRGESTGCGMFHVSLLNGDPVHCMRSKDLVICDLSNIKL